MRKYQVLIISFVTVLVLVIISNFLGLGTEFLAAIVITGISFSIGMIQYKIEDDKIFKSLFTEFNEKFFENYSTIIREYSNSPIPEDSEEVAKRAMTISNYISFCAEEYLWFKKGRIPKDVWLSWENGLVYYLNSPGIKEFVPKSKLEKDSYYGLFERIDSKLID